jgi:hypothetical protein
MNLNGCPLPLYSLLPKYQLSIKEIVFSFNTVLILINLLICVPTNFLEVGFVIMVKENAIFDGGLNNDYR